MIGFTRIGIIIKISLGNDIEVKHMEYERVDGQDKGPVRLFALSTCVWCKKTKRLLDELGVAYEFIFADKAQGQDRDEIIAEMEKWNERLSFPTMVINNEKCIVGFKEDEIREALG